MCFLFVSQNVWEKTSYNNWRQSIDESHDFENQYQG